MNILKVKAKRDINFIQLKEGDKVLVCNIPSLSDMSAESAKNLLPIFRYALGKKFKVSWFDKMGLVAIDFYIHFGPNQGDHTIFVEAYYLRKCAVKTNGYV